MLFVSILVHFMCTQQNFYVNYIINFFHINISCFFNTRLFNIHFFDFIHFSDLLSIQKSIYICKYVYLSLSVNSYCIKLICKSLMEGICVSTLLLAMCVFALSLPAFLSEAQSLVNCNILYDLVWVNTLIFF